jgi:import inner membrane translocase subunit TIM21
MMNQIRRSAAIRINYAFAKSLSNVGLADFASIATNKASIDCSVKRLSVLAKQFAGCSTKGILGDNGIPVFYRGQHTTVEAIMSLRSSVQLMEKYGARMLSPSSARYFSSRAPKKTEPSSETKKDLSAVEDPFDAPTYNIPEKPVTFTEGASYSIVILAALGVAAAAAYAVFKELIFQPKEYKIFNTALKRIQDDSQVRVRIGTPITGYGQESRNRAARQRIPNRVFTDEDGRTC